MKVIGLNSNFYYGDNLWSYGETTTKPDKFGIWKFLIDELVDSESHGQRVWILAHIPSNNYDVLPIQSHIFAAIVKRFSPYTIANLFLDTPIEPSILSTIQQMTPARSRMPLLCLG